MYDNDALLALCGSFLEGGDFFCGGAAVAARADAARRARTPFVKLRSPAPTCAFGFETPRDGGAADHRVGE